MSVLEKTRCRNQKLMYDRMVNQGIDILKPPYFMQPPKESIGRNKENMDPTNKRKRRSQKLPKDPVAPKRMSSRLFAKKTEQQTRDETPNATTNLLEIGEPYSKIKPFFTPSEWAKLNEMSKKHSLEAMEEYEQKRKNGHFAQMPKFMHRKQSAESDFNALQSDGSAQKDKLQCDGNQFDNLDNSSEFCFTLPQPDQLRRFEEEPLQWDGNQFDNSDHSSDQSSFSGSCREQVSEVNVSKPGTSGTLAHIRMSTVNKSTGNMVSQPVSKVSNTNFRKRRPTVPLMRPVDNEMPCDGNGRPWLAHQSLEVVLPTAIGEMTFIIDWSKMPNSLLRSLQDKERPAQKDRESMILLIALDLKAQYDELKQRNPIVKQKTPGRAIYMQIVKGLFVDFRDSFEDTLNGKTVGDGMFSLFDQLETCVENKYRQKLPRGHALEARGNRKAACILPQKYNPQPNMNKADAAKAESNRRLLRSMYIGRRSEWDWDVVKTYLTDPLSLAAIRKIIVSNDRRFRDLVEKWPFLFEFQGLLTHVSDITEENIFLNFSVFMEDSLDNLLYFMTRDSAQRISNMKVERAMSLCNGPHKKLLGAVSMLANHFLESSDVLFKCAESTTQPQDVGGDLPPTPCIVALGTSVYQAQKFFLCIDNECVSTLNSGLEAVIALCASYFAFGLLYPIGAGLTMTYVERMMANLSDDSGMSKAQTSTGHCTKTALKKIQKLDQKIKDFIKKLD